MVGFLIRFIVSAASLGLTAYVIDGIAIAGTTSVEKAKTAAIAAFLLGILNAVVRPVLIFFTLPLNILTLGLFTFVINAGLLALTARLVDGFKISGFLPALFGAVVLAVVSSILNWLVKDRKEKD
ncbi:MAG: phage holin family protein [Candidatus Eisenbacteria bacterium]|nr:phage holin family protein [Candidatus Eisenbacteria bacterium]MCC7142582.1 phage holin family protein [Candidatus Eisenbacteria bacterium]